MGINKNAIKYMTMMFDSNYVNHLRADEHFKRLRELNLITENEYNYVDEKIKYYYERTAL